MSGTKCKARTRLGEPCKAWPTPDGFCSVYSNPERAAELGRRSGECRRPPEGEPIVILAPKTAGDLHKALGHIFSKVGSGQMDARLGRSLGYIASVLVKTTELSDHEVRLRAIEQMMRSIKSGGTQE
jgi:hypothetical protein